MAGTLCAPWPPQGFLGISFYTLANRGILCIASLESFNKRFLQAFFSKENRFFLTGRAALAGFHLGHRETHDLDLFTLMDAMEEGSAAVAEAAREMGARLESIQTSPDFRRYILTHEFEAIVIDLIRERVAQIIPDKPVMGIIRD